MKRERKSWKERAVELLSEQAAERRLPLDEWVKKRLGWEDWEALGPAAVRFAARDLKRRRGGGGEVLPGGYDAESIAAQAIADLLAGKGRLAPGWTRPRLAEELARLIRRRIRLLASLKEAWVTRSGLDSEQPGPDGEVTSILDIIPDGCGSGCEAAVAQEAAAQRVRLLAEFEHFVAREPELAGLLSCWRTGVTKPAEIAQRLGLEEKVVAAARKRLQRRLIEFGRRTNYSREGAFEGGL